MSKSFVELPADSLYLEDRNISDIIYTWFILNSKGVKGIFIVDKPLRGVYKTLGMSYKTFWKKLNYLIESGYLIDNGDKTYIVDKSKWEMKRYVDFKIITKIHGTGIEDIIKVYTFLATKNSGKEELKWFTRVMLCKKIGYSSQRHSNKIEDIIRKLIELGVLRYESEYKIYEGNTIKINKITKIVG